VYEDGRVYSEKSKKFLKPDLITGYATVTMHNKGKKHREKVHRIVAKLFCDNSGGFNVVNHIDGNKLNNHYTNLEWCTQRHNNIHAIQNGLRNVSLSNSRRWLDDDFRGRVSSKISSTQLLRGCNSGSSNPRYRYQIFYSGDLLQRRDLKGVLGISQSYTDELIRRASNGEVIKLFIDNGIEVKDIKKGQSTIEKALDIESSGIE
jgi:uncharacterized HNH endonuclease L245